jgi:uncharacterized RDD family membrane protein YckC
MKSPGFFRRLAAIVYDSLLLLAVLFFATLLVLPFNHGEAYDSSQLYFPLYLIGVSFVFYGWFWTHGGQTLGLRAWKMRVVSDNHDPLTWWQAWLRFVGALISWGFVGLGFLYIWVNPERKAFHDRVSKTHIESIDQQNSHPPR